MIKFTNKVDTIIHILFGIKGNVKEHDIVGALVSFSNAIMPQYSIAKLQNSGKIGQLKVNINESESANNQKTTGTISIGSNLDYIDNSIMIAVIEAIKKVHLHDAQFKYKNHEATAQNNYAQILLRAKELCLELNSTEDNSKNNIRSTLAEIINEKKFSTFGNFTMGSKFYESDSIIVVEGRKDVEALANAFYYNTFALGGYFFDEIEVNALLKNKKITAFLDGDSGGKAALEKLAKSLEIEYYIKLPPKISVEDLSKKEILDYIKNRNLYDQNK